MHERDSGVRQLLPHSKFLFPGHLPSFQSGRISLLPATRRGWRDIQPQSENIRPSVSSESVSGAQREAETFCQGLTQEIKVGI